MFQGIYNKTMVPSSESNKNNCGALSYVTKFSATNLQRSLSLLFDSTTHYELDLTKMP
jgi:hypothetical protein